MVDMTDTRTDLMDSAELAVRARGFDAFSYADLANKVGIRKASIHHHFPAKADLAVAIMQRYSERHFATLTIVDERETKPSRALAAFIDVYRGAGTDGELLCLCVAFALSKQSLSDALHQEIRNFQTRNIAWLREHVAAAIAARQLRDPADPDAEAIACLALLEGAQILARTAGDASAFSRAVAAFEQRLRFA